MSRRFLFIASMGGLSTALFAQVQSSPQGPAANYVGSLACKACHPAMYESWKQDANGKRRDRSQSASGGYPSRSDEARTPCLRSRKRTSHLSTGPSGSNDTFKRSATTIFRWALNWTQAIKSGGRITSLAVRIGGPHSTRRQTLRAQLDRSVTAAILSTTTSRRRRSRSGMSAARSVTVLEGTMSDSRHASIS